MADHDRSGRGRYGREDRGFTDRARDAVRSWVGDDEAARRRQMDERERDEWRREYHPRPEIERGQGWSSEEAARLHERAFSSEREYGDRDYGWRQPDRARDWGASGDYDRGYTPDATYRATSAPARYEYRRPGYSEYNREIYADPYGRERTPAREWSGERWRVPGPHTGRGPRGYRRSDERIREEINDRLTAHGLIDATDIECRVQGGEVTLVGFVDSRAAKHAAEDVAGEVDGVRDVHNQLRVRTSAGEEGVGRTNVLGITESQVQTPSMANAADSRSKTRG